MKSGGPLIFVFLLFFGFGSLAAQELPGNSGESLAERGVLDVLNIEFFPVLRLFLNDTGDSYNADYLAYYEEKRFIRLGVEFKTPGGLEVNLNLDLTQGILANKFNPYFLNIPYMAGAPLHGFIDTETPMESYIAYEGDLIDLSVGRRKWGLGAGRYSLMAGLGAPWFDGLWFNLHPVVSGHRFDWTFLIASDDPGFVDLWNKSISTAHDTNYLNSNVPLLSPWDGRYFMVHKTTIRGETWKAGVGEMAILVGGADFFSANPTAIWHSAFLSFLNVGVEVSGEKRFGENFRLYGEVMFDDLPTEGGITNPIALAATLGLDYHLLDTAGPYTGPFQSLYLTAKREDSLAFTGGLTLSLQGVYASKYVYSRSASEGVERFTMLKHAVVSRDQADFYNYEHYTGFDYGPDNFLLAFNAAYESPSLLINAGLALLVRGAYGVADQQPPDSRDWTGFTKVNGGASDWFFSKDLAGYQADLTLEAFWRLTPTQALYFRLNGTLATIEAYDNRLLLEAGILFKL
ncbi:MAG: hypothetical protein LBQ61_01455 [Spirochaetales bacterium]|jgi:hypothetical protein|nr:hypothetical protein [Spirochaetales bacterium]